MNTIQTKEERDKTAMTLQRISIEVATALTQGGIEHKVDDGGRTFAIGTDLRVWVEIRPPRPYMGRFDAGKDNWTVDIKEIKTYSRLRQVRVKIGKTGNITFDSNALIERVREKQLLVKEATERETSSKARVKMVTDATEEIKLPDGMTHDLYASGKDDVRLDITFIGSPERVSAILQTLAHIP